MKFFRLDLLTLLISLFILNGCKNENTIGIAPSVQTTGSLLVDSNITVNTVPEDTVVTTNISKLPLTYFNDPIMGTSESNIAGMLNLPGSTAFTIPTGSITVDSAVLVFNYYNTGFYGDSISTRYKVNVFQLKDRPSSSITYYNTYRWDTKYDNTALLGTKQFFARPNDSVKIYNIITGKPDTLHNVRPQIRIPIDKNFIYQSVFNASNVKSNALFQSFTKGLYVTIDKNGTTGPGGSIMLHMDSARVDVFYRVNTGTIDTTSLSLNLANYSLQTKHTYSAAVQSALDNSSTPNKTFYVQGLLGLRTKISFPDLKAIYNSFGGKIVINRAELVVTPRAGTVAPYNPLPKISLYRLDIAKQRIELPDANTSNPVSGGVSTFGGIYNHSQNEYHFIVTGYVQDLMMGNTVDYGTYLGAIDNTNTTSVDIGATPSVTARTVAIGNDPSSPYSIRLNIIYTKTGR